MLGISNKNKRSPSPNLGGYNEWKRQPGEFARKFSAGNDIAGFLRKQITVTEGEGLLLMQGGSAVSKVLLEPGVYDLGNYFKANSVSNASVAVLVDTGTVTLDFSGAGLWTKDHHEISYSMVVSAKIIPENVVNFHNDLMKGREAFSRYELELTFSSLVNGRIKAIVAQCNVSEIGEKSLGIGRQVLGQFSGIELTSVVSIDFDLGKWDRLQRSRADQKVAEERLKDGIRYANLETAAKVNGIENAGVIAKTEQGIAQGLEMGIIDHNIEVGEHIFKAQIEKIKVLQDVETRGAALKNATLKETGEILESQSPGVRVITSPEAAPSIIAIHKFDSYRSMTPEQILAIENPHEAAAAIAIKANCNSFKELYTWLCQDKDAVTRMLQEQYGTYSEQVRSILNTALEANGWTSTARETSRNPAPMVFTGGMGVPVQVNTNAQKNRICPKCGATLRDGAVGCHNCGWEA